MKIGCACVGAVASSMLYSVRMAGEITTRALMIWNENAMVEYTIITPESQSAWMPVH